MGITSAKYVSPVSSHVLNLNACIQKHQRSTVFKLILVGKTGKC